MMRLTITILFVFSFWIPASSTAYARHCLAYALAEPLFVPAGLSQAGSNASVRITYLGHSTFRLRTPKGVVIETDYAGRFRTGEVPTVVTMNHAHETHFTDFPDPAIKHVLRGWNPRGGAAKHDLTVGDVHIRNVSTDIRLWGDQIEPHGNSIFIFEVADLCIGHLGHLHQKLSAEQLALIGRLDIVFAPVDGIYTLDLQSMIGVLKDLRASLVIPMHYFAGESLRAFIAGIRSAFDVRISADATIDASLENLPDQPTVLVLQRY